MSTSLLRRNSSKQGLQNLLRVTAQRSIEDAEEIERERRRRAREKVRAQNGSAGSADSQHSAGYTLEDDVCDSEFKPVSHSAVEEDEGFSDWTQRLEKRRQKRMEEQAPNAEETSTNPSPCPSPSPSSSSSTSTSSRLNGVTRQSSSTSVSILTSGYRSYQNGDNQQQQEEEEGGWGWRKQTDQEEAKERAPTTKHKDWDREKWGRGGAEAEAKKQTHHQVDVRKMGAECKVQGEERKKPLKISYTSKLVLQQEVKHVNGLTDGGDVTSYTTISKVTPRAESLAEEEEVQEAMQERDAKLQSIRLSHQQKEQQEIEELRQRGADAQEELEELNRRREERRRTRDQEDRRREEDEQDRQAREEEERQRMRDDIERRRMEATEKRMKRLSTSSAEEEPFSPLSPKSPSFKNECEERVTTESACSITERTESLNRSLKKSNSLKSAQPPIPISKIDNRLEQYNQAIEEAKASKQALMEIASPPEPVASKKNLFEAGDAWNQNATKTTPSKDAEELKVGVADIINKWGKGEGDGSAKGSPNKPAEVKAGDVLNKKNLWENLGDPSGNGSGPKNSPCGKKYKFVKTRHGKYEKIAIDDDEYTLGKSGEDLDL
ncbi:non-muscle caldesmon-like isoform X2 [Engraulis encrasicolus]|uniref:non-muscle caldesmon-like isoform X2 n=1 Tax=Engraulis encrasicolus TaxID=184585 RepID=UPI002FD6530C